MLVAGNHVGVGELLFVEEVEHLLAVGGVAVAGREKDPVPVVRGGGVGGGVALRGGGDGAQCWGGGGPCSGAGLAKGTMTRAAANSRAISM